MSLISQLDLKTKSREELRGLLGQAFKTPAANQSQRTEKQIRIAAIRHELGSRARGPLL
ncbi:MAG: hypothetical protein AAF720_01475 [Pseudomonadota bacterium]